MRLNSTTQKAKRWIDAYNNSTCYSVRDFYVTRVYRKESIEDRIKERMQHNNYHDYRVLGGNSSFFTCGYKTEDNKTLIIETAYNTFEIEL